MLNIVEYILTVFPSIPEIDGIDLDLWLMYLDHLPDEDVGVENEDNFPHLPVENGRINLRTR